MKWIRLSVFFTTLLFIGIGGFLVSRFARGYRFDFKKFSFVPTGLLVATSVPDGAQLLVNGELKTATNTTINLAPGNYDIEIRKDGFRSWEKRLTITAEIVTKTDAVLFPQVPSFSPLTFTGVQKPSISPDGTKIAYAVIDSSESDKVGLWVLDLFELPLGFSKAPRRVTDADLKNAEWSWSPDSRQILLTTPKGTYLLEDGSFTAQANLINLTTSRLQTIKSDFDNQTKIRLEAQINKLPQDLQDIIKVKAQDLRFSPDNTKLLYKAKGDVNIPQNLIPPVPGASTQHQERSIKKDKTYVYDIKEDRNFEIGQITDDEKITWMPTSRHLLLAQKEKVIIMDYDGTNRQEIFQGTYDFPNVFPFTSGNSLVILTNFGTNIPNLYSLSLR